MSIVASSRTPETPIIDPRTGGMSFQWVKWFQNITTAINNGLNELGQLIGEINAQTKISGRTEGIGTTVQHLNDTGIVQPPGMVAATTSAQGAVVLPAGATSNALGSAALANTTSFDPAGAAATAQSNAETFATAAANTAENNAKDFARDGSNINSGTVGAAYLPALSALSGAVTAAQLPAGVPVVSFGTGAPAGTSTEGYQYFDTTATPYHGYVYHSGAWVQFS